MCRHGRGGAMRMHPLGPSVKLPGRPETREGMCRNGRGDDMWTRLLGPKAIGGAVEPEVHETREGCAKRGGHETCVRCTKHETCEGPLNAKP